MSESLATLTEEEKMSIITELLDLYEVKGNVLLAEDVVEFAKDPKTALHRHFTWDDTKAAHMWRLQQARHIISVSISFSEHAPKVFRPLVSLVKDATVPGGAYRNAADVYNANEEARRRLVKEAIREMQRLRLRYGAVAELEPVFAALENVNVPAPSEDLMDQAA